jgi:hypothetical protein
MEITTTLDYPKLWRTLLRTGIKQRFSQIRSEFFMKIATDGPRTYSGAEAKEDIISKSQAYELCPELKKYLATAIADTNTFKHYSYETESGDMLIEYFADKSVDSIPKELVDLIGVDDYDVDGVCCSWCVDFNNVDNDEVNEETKDWATIHFILIAEGSSTINPDTYPKIIKHELTHACIYETRKLFRTGYFDTLKIPVTWTDEEIASWKDDLAELQKVLDGTKDNLEYHMFTEFVSEFLMYESDGQTKERNPIVESRVPKATKPDAKPKVTYRTLSPIDRFEESMGVYDETYHDWYELILDSLRQTYDDYDKFLDDIRM